MTQRPHNYLVLARAAGDTTIATIKVIDAFSSSASLASMRRQLGEAVARGEFAEQGDCVIWVVEGSSMDGTRNPRPVDAVLRHAKFGS